MTYVAAWPLLLGHGGINHPVAGEGADAGKPEKQGWGRLWAWGGVEQTLKPVERLQARALGPQGAHPPPWQGCISILCTGLVRPWVTHTG